MRVRPPLPAPFSCFFVDHFTSLAGGRITKFKRDGTVIGFFETPGKKGGERGGLRNAHSLAIGGNDDLITGTYEGWVERWKAPGK